MFLFPESAVVVLGSRLSSSFCGKNDTQHHYLPHTDSRRFQSPQSQSRQGPAIVSLVHMVRGPSLFVRPVVLWVLLETTWTKLLNTMHLQPSRVQKPGPEPHVPALSFLTRFWLADKTFRHWGYVCKDFWAHKDTWQQQQDNRPWH